MKCYLRKAHFSVSRFQEVKDALRDLLSFVAFGLCKFTEIFTSPWVLFTFFKMYKWYQIAQSITYVDIIYHTKTKLKKANECLLDYLPNFLKFVFCIQ